MPIDMNFFRNLTREEQISWEAKLRDLFASRFTDLEAIERKIKYAMVDDTKPSDLSALILYRDEVKKDLNQIRSDLDQIDRFNRNEEFLQPDPVSVAGSVGGAGVVSLRPNDKTGFKKVPGTKTLQEILDARKKQEDSEREQDEIARLYERLKKIDDYKKIEAKKRVETTKL